MHEKKDAELAARSLRRYIVVNYLGKGWATLIGVALLPLFLARLGSEAFALIGTFSVLLLAVGLFDFGMTPTLAREVARFRGGGSTAQSLRDLVRSIELIYAALALVIVAAVVLLAPVLADRWLRPEALDRVLIEQALMLMSVALAARAWEQLYRAALQGAEDHVRLNLVHAIAETARWGGGLLVLAFFANDVRMFFVWQGLVAICSLAVLRARFQRVLPAAPLAPRFAHEELRRIGRYAGGMFLSALLVFLLTQSDKILGARLLPLAALGYYLLASTAAAGLLQLITPLNVSVFPRLAEHYARDAHRELGASFMMGCQLMTALVMPCALVMAAFPAHVLVLWTGDAGVVADTAPVLAVLSLASLASAVMNMPYMLQLAAGWTGLSIRLNAIALVIAIPALAMAIPRYGAIGAAAVLLGLNIAYVVIGATLMFRRLLPELSFAWARDCVALPLAAGGTVAALLHWRSPPPTGRGAAALVLALAGFLVCAAIWSVLPVVRSRITAHVFALKGRAIG